MAYFRFRRSTEVKRCFTEVKVIFTEEKPRSTEVKSRLTVVKPRFTECAVRFIEVLDPSGNRDSITSRGAKRPCRHGARAQKRPNAGKQLENCCHCLARSDNFEKMSEFTRAQKNSGVTCRRLPLSLRAHASQARSSLDYC